MRKDLKTLLELAKVNPLIGLAALPPIGWTSTARRYVADQIALEQTRARLRAVTGDDYERYVIVAETLRKWSEQRVTMTGQVPLNERMALNAVYALICHGEEPTNVNVHEKYQLMIWGCLL